MTYNNHNSSAGAKPASFSLFYASCQGDAKNTSYPFKKVISSLDKLVQVAAYDHVGCRFRTGENNRGTRVKAYRSNRTFYSADVIIMDVDNVSANPLDPDLTESEWMTPANVAAAFPDVPFYVVYSRHHMQEKNGRSARPKFHVYFPLYREITDYMELEDLKRKVQRMFPAFDPNATKVTQFMFAVSSPKAEYYPGSVMIDQFIKNDEKLPEVIQEGHRNETLSKYAGKVITRLGDTKKAREAFDKAAERCCPPLDSDEVEGIWRSAQSFFHTTVETSKGYVEPDDYDEAGGHNKKPKGFTVDDLEAILTKLGIKLLINDTINQTEVTGLPQDIAEGSRLNVLPGFIKNYLNSQGIYCARADLMDFLLLIAERNRYNPVKIMLSETVWDEKDRLTDLTDRIIGASKREAVYIRKWLHQCIAMALNDDKHPLSAAGVLVFQGEQGIGKTMLCSKLAVKPEWFKDGASIDTTNKDTIIQSTGCWIVELGELDSTLKNEQSALKAFLSTPKDTYRTPYARAAVTKPRRTSFCGTVNTTEFLNDETGSRRFWVVDGNNIDLDRVLELDEEWAKQLWAQVYKQLYLPNPTGFYLTKEESKAMQIANEAYAKMMTGEIEVMDKLNFNAPIKDWRWMKVSELTEALNAKGVGSIHIGRVLAKLMRTDKRVKRKKCQNVKYYCLPPMCTSFNTVKSVDEDFGPVLE